MGETHLQQLDNLASENYGEFGFNTCSEEQQEELLKLWLKSKIDTVKGPKKV